MKTRLRWAKADISSGIIEAERCEIGLKKSLGAEQAT
jgi:hypothetical protein